MVLCESIVEEELFEWSQDFTDSKVRTASQNSIIHTGSEKVEWKH